MTANADLARRARDLAARARDGSPDRRAFGCAAVALAATRSPAAARKVLADECPPGVAPAAIAALDELTRSPQPERTTRRTS